jgi:hypothetical protein
MRNRGTHGGHSRTSPSELGQDFPHVQRVVKAMPLEKSAPPNDPESGD